MKYNRAVVSSQDVNVCNSLSPFFRSSCAPHNFTVKWTNLPANAGPRAHACQSGPRRYGSITTLCWNNPPHLLLARPPRRIDRGLMCWNASRQRAYKKMWRRIRFVNRITRAISRWLKTQNKVAHLRWLEEAKQWVGGWLRKMTKVSRHDVVTWEKEPRTEWIQREGGEGGRKNKMKCGCGWVGENLMIDDCAQ